MNEVSNVVGRWLSHFFTLTDQQKQACVLASPSITASHRLSRRISHSYQHTNYCMHFMPVPNGCASSVHNGLPCRPKPCRPRLGPQLHTVAWSVRECRNAVQRGQPQRKRGHGRATVSYQIGVARRFLHAVVRCFVVTSQQLQKRCGGSQLTAHSSQPSQVRSLISYATPTVHQSRCKRASSFPLFPPHPPPHPPMRHVPRPTASTNMKHVLG